MTPTPLEIALERIEECRRTRALSLDLSELELEEIPEQVFELTWLKALNFFWDWHYLGKLQEIPSTIENLTELMVLDFSRNQIKDLSPISGLSALHSLSFDENKVSDLSPLSKLSALKSLSCGGNLINDLSALSKLSSLQKLDFSGNCVRDLSPLHNLGNLKTLICWFNQITDLSPIYNHVISGQLESISLRGNPVHGVPASIFGVDKTVIHGCLKDLRNYWLDLAKGKETQRQLKVQFVGNGRVGKTTLAYALEHKHAPSEAFQSTHGIVIKEIQQTLEGEDEPVTLQLWDFGGQEIYHATHRLFLADDCLYLLLWAEETDEHPEKTCHPVNYWLEAIHDLGRNSPIILVKNQIDRADHLPARPTELTENLPGVQQIRQEVKISAMQYRGMPALRGAIESVLEELKPKICLELPTSWLNVQRQLQALTQETIPFAYFQQLCIKAGVHDARWFAGYLHKTGVFFYRQGLFQDQIILDQNWAIEAVYRVFDPYKPHRRWLERMGGRFTGADASLIWAEAEGNEREVYVDFMRGCGICYEPHYRQNRTDKKPFAEREFIIPALLPTTSTAQIAWGEHRADDWLLEIQYPFLHRSIIERMILRLGETFQGEPWRTGIFCQTDAGQLLLDCDYQDKAHSTQGILRFQLRGSQLERLVYDLRRLVSEVSPHRRYEEYLTPANEERRLLPDFQEQRMEQDSPLDTPASRDKTIKLFISYSHADEAHKIQLEKHLKAISRTLPLSYWSDRHLFAGEPVDEQIFQQLNTADIVLLLVSPDFINSDYCFTKEMERALERYEQEGNVVIPVIIRHTASWRSHKIGQIVALPKDGKPLSQWTDADEFWASVEDGIRAQVEKLR